MRKRPLHLGVENLGVKKNFYLVLRVLTAWQFGHNAIQSDSLLFDLSLSLWS